MTVALAGLLFWLAADPSATRRAQMVREQMEERGVRDPGVLRVMRAVPRHEFMPAAVRGQAYEDHPVGIGFGATISQPYIVAAMTELLGVSGSHKVLEIGTGSGYQAAVLSHLAREVYSVEIVPELAASAGQTLERLGHRNVTVRQGDGYRGWPEQAPFDRIILTAAPPEIPQLLIDQLKPGGRLVAPVGRYAQELVVIEKNADGRVRRRSVFPVMFVPMVPARP
ncbi:MAG TPA: protein-L-isoaspartate(D-aspartate) O-methyltransferase [Beijerinckiaceae bacterium]|nr:protein-L-isoaspartate(D-aspartate) O-methyltransferase [Beijerinckiaceae bacterium]